MFEINCGDEGTRIAKSVLHYGVKFCKNLKSFNAGHTCRRGHKIVNIEYIIPWGETPINFNENRLIISYKKIGDPFDNNCQAKIYGEVIIKDPVNDTPDLLKSFLEESKKYYNDVILDKKNDANKVTINIYDEYCWDELRKLPKRSIDSIYLDKAQWVLDDMKEFLSKETEEEYKKFCIPYKKNYLFEGVPGSGKSSLTHALASSLEKDICIINFDHKTTDTLLNKALTRLSDDDILVLEDIDVLFTERKKNKDSISPITFSGLLNILDGFGHQEKLITIMTTNYKCNLDPALQRKGRIDEVVHFDYAKKPEVKRMFDTFLPEQKDNFDMFYDKIKGKDVTISMLQHYFFENKKEKRILDNIKILIKDIDDFKFEKREVNMYM